MSLVDKEIHKVFVVGRKPIFTPEEAKARKNKRQVENYHLKHPNAFYCQHKHKHHKRDTNGKIILYTKEEKNKVSAVYMRKFRQTEKGKAYAHSSKRIANMKIYRQRYKDKKKENSLRGKNSNEGR